MIKAIQGTFELRDSSWRTTLVKYSVLIALLLPLPAAAGQFEAPPALPAQTLAPAGLVSGAGFHVDNPVPTDGLMALFTIRSDVGTFPAPGIDLLRIRVAELPAIVQLKNTSRTGVFAQSLADSAARPIKAAGQMLMNPADTVAGLPGGVQRFFGRVSHGAEQIAAAAQSDQGGAAVASGAVQTTRDVLGYEQVRRELAHKLNVDPYTTNPVLVPLLDEIATVAFRARVAVNVTISVAVPGSIAITGTTMVSNWVWDTPRADLVVRNQNKLKALGVPNQTIRAFANNARFPLSVQTDFVENLSHLSAVSGCADAAVLASTIQSEVQARFLTDAVKMLVRFNARSGLSRITAIRTVVGFSRGGAVVVPAPVDYVSWTQRIANFASRPDLKGSKKVAMLTGQMSPIAKKHFHALGWTVYERVPI